MMDLLFYGMLSIAVFCVVALGTFYIGSHSAALLTARSFSQIITPQRTSLRSNPDDKASAKLLALVRLARSSLRLTDDPNLQRHFECAALAGPGARDVYFAARFCGPFIVGLLCSLSPYARVLCIGAGVGIAYLAPAIVLSRLVKRHREKVRLAIPDAIDLLVICVDAGLGLDQAMVRVGEELVSSHPAISHEFALINRAQRAGTVRLDAWRDMAKRTAVTETEALVNMLMQTERFGTPIARALSSFGDNIRQKRRQRAEEAAAKTTIKIIFPLVLFIFPCIFIVLLGPAAISIFRSMAAK
ncbi:MAG: type II secretion system F family protein [Janthinobacterium lividum]